VAAAGGVLLGVLSARRVDPRRVLVRLARRDDGKRRRDEPEPGAEAEAGRV
jgi:hypothetical protein